MNRTPLFMLVGLLLLVFWLGARSLDADAIWNDEFYSIYDAGGALYGPKTPLDIWNGVAERNPWHTPGFFLILGGWGALTGWQPPTLRLLSLLFGLLAVAWTYRLGRDWLAPQAGLYAAALVGLSVFFIHYTHEIRMYTLLVLLVAFTLWAYLRIVRSAPPPRRLLWLGLLCGMVGLLYIHYYAALVLVMIGVYHLALLPSGLPRRRWLNIAGVMLLAGLLFLPWAGTLLAGLTAAAESTQLHERALTPPEILLRIGYLFGNGEPLALAVGLVLALVGSLPLLRQRQMRARVSTIWVLALGLVGLLLLANLLLRIMHEGRVRYVIMLWTPLALLVALGLYSLRQRLPRAGGLLVWLLLGGWFAFGLVNQSSAGFSANLDGIRYDFPLDVIAARLRDEVQAEDVVVSYLPDGSPIWVAERNQDIAAFYFSGVPVVSSTMRMPNTPELRSDALEFTRQSLGGRLRVWLAHRQDEPRPLLYGDLVERMGDDGYALCRTIQSDDFIHIDLYTRETLCCLQYDKTEPQIARYGGDITLTGVQLLPVEDEGGRLPVIMTWAQAASVPPYVYSVALHLWAADGTVVAQADYGLEIPATTCQRALLEVAALEPGEYTLHAAVYDWQTGERLPGVNAAGEAAGDMLPIATVMIE